MRYCKNCNRIIPDGDPYCRYCAPPDATPDDSWAFSPLGDIVYVDEDEDTAVGRVSVETMEQQPEGGLTETQQFNLAFDFNDLTLITEAVQDPDKAEPEQPPRPTAPHTPIEDRRRALHTLLRDITGEEPTVYTAAPRAERTAPVAPEIDAPAVTAIAAPAESRDVATPADTAEDPTLVLFGGEHPTVAAAPAESRETTAPDDTAEDPALVLFGGDDETETAEPIFFTPAVQPADIGPAVPEPTDVPDDVQANDPPITDDATDILFGDEPPVHADNEPAVPAFAVFDGTPTGGRPQIPSSTAPRTKERDIFRRSAGAASGGDPIPGVAVSGTSVDAAHDATAESSSAAVSGAPVSLETWLTQHDQLDFDDVEVELPEPPVVAISRKEPGALEKELKAQASQPGDGDASRPYGKFGVTVIVVLLLGFLAVVGLSVGRLLTAATEEELVLRELSGSWLSEEFSLRDEPDVALREHLTLAADGGFTTVCYEVTDDADGYRNDSWPRVYDIAGTTELYVGDSILLSFSYRQGDSSYYFIREVLTFSDDELVVREYYDETREDYYDMVFTRVPQ